MGQGAVQSSKPVAAAAARDQASTSARIASAIFSVFLLVIFAAAVSAGIVGLIGLGDQILSLISKSVSLR